MHYYEITVVNKTNREVKSVPVSHDFYLDCQEGENREAIVQIARSKNWISQEDLKHICEVENLSSEDYKDLLEYNRELARKMTPEKKQKIIDHLFTSARGYGMAESNGIQSAFNADGNYMPDRRGGSVEGGKLAFSRCIKAIPEELLEDFIYTLLRIADKSGEEGFSWR